ncbi:hypothetical protein ACTG9Q_32625 [Actinokineospora sp. 24-640]
MLIPFLWRRHPFSPTGNLAVDSAMVLRHAFAHLGIVATVVAVDLWVGQRRGSQVDMIARPDPRWDDGRFDGHCVLVLPQSKRLVDATVDQFAAVRRHRNHPVIGRVTLTSGTSAPPPGTHLGVADASGQMLLYTVVGPDPVEVVSSADVVRSAQDRYRRAGTNLASHALTLLRLPEVRERIRRANYPRLNSLLDRVGQSDFFVDRDGDFSFAVDIEGRERVQSLDQITPAETDPLTSRLPDDEPPHVTSDPNRVKEILQDVSAAARVHRTAVRTMGDGHLPVVFFEPRAWVGMEGLNGSTREAQAEMIISAGFARFLPGTPAVPRLRNWSVIPALTGLELWDGGGIWARSELAVDEEWRVAAAAHGAVLVIYGVRVGVRPPTGSARYSEADRESELAESRRAGIVAAAEIPWAEDGPRTQPLWRRVLRRAER